MKRRYFMGISLLLLSSLRAASAKSKSALGLPLKSVGPLKITNEAMTIDLKRGDIVELPENPKPIDTVLHFSLKKYRFGKSPEIKMNGQKYDGQERDSLVITKDVQLHDQLQFVMQYIGEDIGWILLV